MSLALIYVFISDFIAHVFFKRLVKNSLLHHIMHCDQYYDILIPMFRSFLLLSPLKALKLALAWRVVDSEAVVLLCSSLRLHLSADSDLAPVLTTSPSQRCSYQCQTQWCITVSTLFNTKQTFTIMHARFVQTHCSSKSTTVQRPLARGYTETC